MKIRKIEFETEEEMEQSLAENDYKFHKLVVDSALKNIDSKKKEIKIISILTKSPCSKPNSSVVMVRFKGKDEP